MSDTDTELLERAVGGDATALRDLLRRYGAQARAVIARKLDRRMRSLVDEDDVMQVAYLEAFLHIDQLMSRDPVSFVAWLTRIAQNALTDAVRGLQRDKRPNPARRVYVTGSAGSHVALLELLGSTESTPSRCAAASEAAGTLDQAILKLPPDYRTVVQLCDLEGISVAEVGERMGRSAGAVHMLRARAHDRLRELLGAGSQFFTGSA